MRLVGFIDELVKLGVAEKLSNAFDNSNISQEPPPEMAGYDTIDPPDRLAPGEAGTRLPKTSHLPGQMKPGELGGVTDAKEQIDRGKFNRPYQVDGV